MRIAVTQKHIEQGHRGRPCSCPVALALVDAGINEPFVSTSYVVIDDARVPLPFAAWSFIHAFDANRDAYPFNFELAVNPK